ncbi:unnamed protein product [Chironomus riparius]|uniref:Uncharacterized protein n=1 Tax=Chironomus riparius TaxID=315576 RepID=A0A9N9SB76_9DIPT|nr:unnamed protein product [Chironomus riparius]
MKNCLFLLLTMCFALISIVQAGGPSWDPVCNDVCMPCSVTENDWGCNCALSPRCAGSAFITYESYSEPEPSA